MEEATVTKLGIIPIAYQFLEELEIAALFDTLLETGKEDISHGRVASVLLLNLLDGSSPLYKLYILLEKVPILHLKSVPLIGQ